MRIRYISKVKTLTSIADTLKENIGVIRFLISRSRFRDEENSFLESLNDTQKEFTEIYLLLLEYLKGNSLDTEGLSSGLIKSINDVQVKLDEIKYLIAKSQTKKGL